MKELKEFARVMVAPTEVVESFANRLADEAAVEHSEDGAVLLTSAR